ncbi:MAG: pre-peptidase C-terminal domain-containing protein, partial [Caldilineaceae bacterium]
SFNDWVAFICSVQPAGLTATCNSLAGAGYSLDASDFNSPSIAIGDLVGTQTVRRSVTNVTGQTRTFNAAASLAGYTVVVSPSSLTLAPGATGQFTVALTNTGAPLGSYREGVLSWSDSVRTVRSPIVVRPVAVGAPSSVSYSGVSGSQAIPVRWGTIGSFSQTVRGLTAATMTDDVVVADPDQSFDPNDGFSNSYEVVVPAGATLVRFSLFDEFTDGEDDLDLYLLNSAGALVGTSQGGTAAEEISSTTLAPGTYTLWVHGWGPDGPDARYKLFWWIVDGADSTNATASPVTTTAVGQLAPVTFGWHSLAANNRYLGWVGYGATGVRTVVNVDTFTAPIVFNGTAVDGIESLGATDAPSWADMVPGEIFVPIVQQ